VIEDLDRLRHLGRRVVVAMSVTTDDEQVRRAFEPTWPRIRNRVDALAELHAAGIRTQASLSPILPCDPDALADLIEAHCDWIVAQAFKVGSTGARTWKPALESIRKRDWDAWLRGGPAVEWALGRLREGFGTKYHEGQEGFGLRWYTAGD
jgi:DNA repair photolyase